MGCRGAEKEAGAIAKKRVGDEKNCKKMTAGKNAAPPDKLRRRKRQPAWRERGEPPKKRRVPAAPQLQRACSGRGVFAEERFERTSGRAV